MLIDHLTTVQKVMETTGLSADDILKMDMSEYGRLTGRQSPAETATQALDAEYTPSVPQVPQQPHAPVQEARQSAQGLDIGSMDMQTYAQLRAQLGVGGREYGVGVMNSGAGTADWVAAARTKVGRTKYGQQNTQDAARIDAGKYLRANEPVTGRATYYR